MHGEYLRQDKFPAALASGMAFRGPPVWDADDHLATTGKHAGLHAAYAVAAVRIDRGACAACLADWLTVPPRSDDAALDKKLLPAWRLTKVMEVPIISSSPLEGCPSG